jgi:hypothetical protein
MGDQMRWKGRMSHEEDEQRDQRRRKGVSDRQTGTSASFAQNNK